MDTVFTIEMTDLPPAGGLTGDPSALPCVDEFLCRESNYEKVANLLQEDSSVLQYRSMIDCLLVELAPQFREECLEFYEGRGKPLVDRHPAETIPDIDRELELALEILISRKWLSWSHFKRSFKKEKSWEAL